MSEALAVENFKYRTFYTSFYRDFYKGKEKVHIHTHNMYQYQKSVLKQCIR